MGFLFIKKSKKPKRPVTAAVIAAAGQSSRMDGVDKLFAPLYGAPVIAHTLLAFERCEHVDEIVVATASGSIIQIGDICKQYGISKATQILCGGASRMDSVYAAMMNVAPNAEYIAIHDGARPLIRPEMISDLFECAYQHGAAVPIIPLKDTIKLMDGTTVAETLDRNKLGSVQTPQVFQLGLIKGAISKAIQDSVVLTDDSAAVERLGMKIKSLQGSPDNIKITTPEDLAVAEALMEWRKY